MLRHIYRLLFATANKESNEDMHAIPNSVLIHFVNETERNKDSSEGSSKYIADSAQSVTSLVGI